MSTCVEANQVEFLEADSSRVTLCRIANGRISIKTSLSRRMLGRNWTRQSTKGRRLCGGKKAHHDISLSQSCAPAQTKVHGLVPLQTQLLPPPSLAHPSLPSGLPGHSISNHVSFLITTIPQVCRPPRTQSPAARPCLGNIVGLPCGQPRPGHSTDRTSCLVGGV